MASDYRKRQTCGLWSEIAVDGSDGSGDVAARQ